jgi:adenosine kinase
MSILVCGSLAFDSIAVFPGRFAEQILPDQLHILNVAFLVPELRREYGGCAGNIAYNVAGLGAEAIVVAAIGSDGDAYLERLRGFGIDTRHVRRVGNALTAQAYIVTDADNNQITAFHPGAMQFAHEAPIPDAPGATIAIVAPDGREAMLRHAEQLAAAAIPFVFDPGQGLPMFDGAALRHFVSLASWVAVNDYEAKMLCDRTGLSLEAMSRSASRGIVVTLGADGCELWQDGVRTAIGGVPASRVVDPTGCGDAFRGGLLVGLERGLSLAEAAALGNRLGAAKIAHRGGQNHTPGAVASVA